MGNIISRAREPLWRRRNSTTNHDARDNPQLADTNRGNPPCWSEQISLRARPSGKREGQHSITKKTTPCMIFRVNAKTGW